MRYTDALIYSFEHVRARVARAVDGLDEAALAWRPDPHANSIAWLVWHLTRVMDAQVNEIAAAQQVWVAGEWAQRFGLPPGYTDSGYGHSSDEVAAIRPAGPEVLVEYHEHVSQATTRQLADLPADDLDRIIDRSYDPPVTVGIRLMSVNGDALQHIGQAAYLRGLLDRR